MAHGKANRRTAQLFHDLSAQGETFEKSPEELAVAERGLPVECLGLTFENEGARRAHFLAELRKGLEELHARLAGVPFADVDDTVTRLAAVEHWPTRNEADLRDLAERMARAERPKDLLQRWKEAVGFPDGTIEAVLALSDPPWHTACPNPFLGAFVEAHGKPYDPVEPYRRKPFEVDVSEGNAHPVFRAHGYHARVPHLAIVPSILHYTEPGDLVLDGFAGSGMTGVAAQWCETAPESYRKTLEARWTAEGFGKPKWGARRALLNDLSPAASFIAANYTLPFDVDAFAEAGRTLLDEVEKGLGWMYETQHIDGKTKGRIDYTVWSEVFSCPVCANEVTFLEKNRGSGGIRDGVACPNCDTTLDKGELERTFRSDMDAVTGQLRNRVAYKPVLIQYKADGRTFTKAPDACDQDIIRRIEEAPLPQEVPTERLPIESMYYGSRLASKGITHIHHFFLPRAAHVLAAMWRRADAHPDSRIRRMLFFLVEQGVFTFSLLNRYRPSRRSQSNQVFSGSYYIPAQIAEGSIHYSFEAKFVNLVNTFRDTLRERNYSCITATNTTAHLGLSDDSVDYIFTDPPLGDKIYYADLNFLVESWHGVRTNAVPEAIVDRFKDKGLPEYRRLMLRCFEEYHRTLKPGRWITIVFRNARGAVWTAIQEALLAVGFVVADMRAMNKIQDCYRQITGTAVEHDLVISAYKPNNALEERFALQQGTEDGVWGFVRAHLDQLPVFVRKNGRVEIVTERQPHLLFDRMTAFHVVRNAKVPLSAGEFLSGLVWLFPERDGMAFLPGQVAEYDRGRASIEDVAQPESFVVDESTAVQWLKRHLERKPQSFREVHPLFLREIGDLRKHEKMPGLSEMLEQNFLCYGGSEEVPSQIHVYLSANFKELRNLARDHPILRAHAENRWYVPDPNKAADMETRRTRVLLREFEECRQSPQSRLGLVRLDAMRAGFFNAFQKRDYETIINVAEKIPETVLHEDPMLLLWYDQALMRAKACA